MRDERNKRIEADEDVQDGCLKVAECDLLLRVRIEKDLSSGAERVFSGARRHGKVWALSANTACHAAHFDERVSR